MELVTIIIGYLLGSIPWALVIGKVFYQVDIREKGSGNLGGSNAGRVLGKKAGIIVILLDAFKALLAMLISYHFFPASFTFIYTGLACCIGHCFPLFANFKGGKAVATSFGFLLGISILHHQEYLYLIVIPLIFFFLLLYLYKYVSLASLSSLGIAFIISLLIQEPLNIQISLFILWLFVIYRHQANIYRLINKKETKVKWL